MSDFFKLNFFDLFKAAIVAGMTVLLQGLWTIFEAGGFPDGVSFIAMLKTAGIAAAAYLVKQLLTSSTGDLGPEPK